MPPNFLKFDKNYLNELTTRAESGVIKKICKYHVALHPAQLNNFKESLEWEVGRKIGKYDEIFKGILLGFENLKLLSKLGTIGTDNSFIHLDIEASFFIFNPEIRMILPGIVTRTTKDHVGCLVYNVFNISIPKPVAQENWIGNNISLQSEVEFKIIYVDLFGRLPHIRGELKSILSTAEISPNKLKNKKQKFKNLSQLTNEEDSISQKLAHIKFDQEEKPMNIEEMEYEISPEKPKKKHRKKTKSEGDLSNSNNTESTMEISATTVEQPIKEKKKSEKRTKSENLDVSLDPLDLNSLFSSSQNFDYEKMQIGTPENSTKKLKRRKSSASSSISQQVPGDLKLDMDSDLEAIIGNT